MKRFMVGILMLAMLCASLAFGAGSSMTVSGDDLTWSTANNRQEIRMITVIFTADDTDGTIPDLTLNASTASITHGAIAGWYGYKVIIDGNHGGTEPTENSELYIYENAFDLLAAGGENNVDNTAERQVFFNNATMPVRQPISTDLTVTVTQEAAATNDATGTIYIYFVAQ